MVKAGDTRPEQLGRYIVSTGCTVRAAAAVFGVSKSTVFTDVTRRLLGCDRRLWLLVNGVLQKNKSERHLRGGAATREKYRLAAVTRRCK